MRWLVTLSVLCAVALNSSVIASADPTAVSGGGPRLRPQSPHVAGLLKAGLARSATLRSLVDRIEAGNVIVYIAVNPLLKSNLSGGLTWMTRAGAFRFVRASINRDLTPDQMIATLAHELQHVAEVAEDESVISEATLVAMYRRIGLPSRAAAPGFETAAAQEMGYQVRRELTSSVTRVAEITQL
jgi:hypothetical protein